MWSDEQNGMRGPEGIEHEPHQTPTAAQVVPPKTTQRNDPGGGGGAPTGGSRLAPPGKRRKADASPQRHNAAPPLERQRKRRSKGPSPAPPKRGASATRDAGGHCRRRPHRFTHKRRQSKNRHVLHNAQIDHRVRAGSGSEYVKRAVQTPFPPEAANECFSGTRSRGASGRRGAAVSPVTRSLSPARGQA